MLDVYDWILSPEIREHMRANYPLSLEEKLHIICGGFRSIAEKEAALQTLLEESGEERAQVEALLRLYGLAAEELRKTGPEQLFALPAATCARNRKRDSLIYSEAFLYSSYAELLAFEDDWTVRPYLCASKWERVNGVWKIAIEFDVQEVNGVPCTTRFWPGEEKEKQWGIDAKTMEQGYGGFSGDRLPYPLPFMTGDLVKLDAPSLEKPLFGVMDNVLDLNGTRYLWFGYVNADRLDALELSYGMLHHGGGYRVIDWLHSARPEELPEGEEILKEIGEYLSRQPRQNGATSDASDEFLYFFGADNPCSLHHRTAIPFSKLLAQVRKWRGRVQRRGGTRR